MNALKLLPARKRNPETRMKLYSAGCFKQLKQLVRLYLHGGDDRCIVTGDVASSIVVRVVGGGGDDESIYESHVRGVLWGFIPFIPQAERCTFFYDDKGNNKFVAGASSKVDKSNYEPPAIGLTQY